MTDEPKITEQELKLILLVSRFDNMQQHCNEIAERMKTQLAWKHEIAIVERDVRELKESMLEQSNSLTWAVRLFFGTMLSSAAGLIVWIIQKV